LDIALPEVARAPIARLAAAAAVLGTILLALGAWLFVPRERAGGSPTLPPLRICLVDVSDSVTQGRVGAGPELERLAVAEARRAESAGEDFCAIVYGTEVRRVFGPAPARTFPREPRLTERDPRSYGDGVSRTKLAAALEAAGSVAAEPGRAACTLVLVGDDTYTGADPVPLLRALRERGVALERVDLALPRRADVTIGPLVLPRSVEAGSPLAVEGELFYTPEGGSRPASSLTLYVSHRSASGSTPQRVEIPVPPGLDRDEDGCLRWRFRVDVGPAGLGLNRVSCSAASPVPSRVSAGIVRGGGNLVVGVVRSLPLFSGPAVDGVEFELVDLQDLAASLDHLDAIVTCRLSPDELPRELLASFVQRGGGWLSFSDDAFLRGFLAGASELLPLRPAEDPKPRDVVVLADRSGSMVGEPLAHVRRAALALVDAAPAADSVALRWFGDRLGDAIPLKAADDPRPTETIQREAARRLEAGIGAGGRTAIARSLESFAVERERSARDALVFLLSDGRDTVDADASERCARVLARLVASRTRLVVLAAGEEPDRELLSKLIVAGEELRSVGALDAPGAANLLTAIFRRELTANRVREGPRLRVLPSGALLDPAAPSTLGADILRGQKPELAAGWPPIQRYVRTQVASGAELVWSSEKGEPLLAIHRVGLGAVAACAFAPVEGWGADWARRADLWAPLLRALARGKRDATPIVRIAGDEVTVEDLGPDTPAELEARVFPAGSRVGDPPAAVVPLSPPTQGADPRRVRAGRWPSSAAAALEDPVEGEFPRVELHARAAAAAWPPIALPLPTSRAPEFVLPRTHLHADELFARPTGAGDRPRVAASMRAHPAAPKVLFSGLFLLTCAGLAGFFARRAR